MSAISPEDVVDSASIAAASAKRPSLFRLAIRNPSVIFGSVILLVMLTIAILAPVLGTVDPTRIDPAARWSDGKPITTADVGTVLGLAAAFFKGVTDIAIMRLMDIMLALPSLLLAISVVAVLGPSLFNAMFAVSIVQLPHFARLTRAAVLTELTRPYVTASRVSGAVPGNCSAAEAAELPSHRHASETRSGERMTAA